MGAPPKSPEAFRAFLKGHGLKLTEQRRLIVERALSNPEHFSAEDLFLALKGRGISKATVYRTLALLVSADLLDAVDLLDKGYKLYEVAAGHEHHHDHLICLRCGRIVEFHCDPIERIQNEIARSHGFEIEHHTHRIYGTCAACRGRKSNGRR